MAFLHKIGYNKEKTEGFIMKNFKKGFTIAEVIVTLVLIGIVAAISIPSIYINHQKRVDRTRIKNAIVTFDSLIREVDISLGRASTTTNIKNKLTNNNCENLPNYMTIVYNKGCIVSTPDGTWWDFTNGNIKGETVNATVKRCAIRVRVAANEKDLGTILNPSVDYSNGAYLFAIKTNEGLQINNMKTSEDLDNAGIVWCSNHVDNNTKTYLNDAIEHLEKFKN